MKKSERTKIVFNRVFEGIFKVNNIEKLMAAKKSMEETLRDAEDKLCEAKGKNKQKEEEIKETENKDILKKLRNRVKEVKRLQENPNYKSIVTEQNKTLEERAETIKSLKSELEIKETNIRFSNKVIEDLSIDMDYLKSDRETWKKIAERLAERVKTEGVLDSNCYEEDGHTFCKKEKNNCKQCIIDWARSEVNEDE